MKNGSVSPWGNSITNRSCIPDLGFNFPDAAGSPQKQGVHCKINNDKLPPLEIIKLWARSSGTFFFSQRFCQFHLPSLFRPSRVEQPCELFMQSYFCCSCYFLHMIRLQPWIAQSTLGSGHKERGGRSVLGCPHWLFQIWGLLSPTCPPSTPSKPHRHIHTRDHLGNHPPGPP